MTSQSQHRDLNFSHCKFKLEKLIMLLLKDFYNNYIVDASFFLHTIAIDIDTSEFDVVDVEHSIE